MRHYTQLTEHERYQIYALMKAGQDQSEVAKVIGVDKATVSREVSRNRGLRGYSPKQAQCFMLARRTVSRQPRTSTCLWRRVETWLRQEWSPE